MVFERLITDKNIFFKDFLSPLMFFFHYELLTNFDTLLRISSCERLSLTMIPYSYIYDKKAPLFFIIYINDMPNSKNTLTAIYANDILSSPPPSP